ncbi:hypothetical protein DFH08DRAFT_848554 [Mycena albidolilacea]|uniref:Uncharacterized protein n=1 Tax=Mycena albidolilacea TaxID=1033008 RepID=A0AAD7AH39_9AGAR|nr:hypothetical protein DFH08DRAFT_848554 [Mycena albidolilacea]
MLSVLAHIFCCCPGVRARDGPDPAETTATPTATERTRLIDPPTPPASINVAEDESVKERMDTIVRAKEGKMFNVGRRAPSAGSSSRIRYHTNSQESLRTTKNPSPSSSESSLTVARSVERESESEPPLHESPTSPGILPPAPNPTPTTLPIAFDW